MGYNRASTKHEVQKMSQDTKKKKKQFQARGIFFTILAVILPYILLMNAILIVFTKSFLEHEYRLPDFPADPYGFTLEERIEYGNASVDYITSFESDETADAKYAALKMKDGTQLFNERELSHMKDVRVVFKNARLALFIMVAFVLCTLWLTCHKVDALPGLCNALLWGGGLSLGLMGVILVLILTGFDSFFTTFHSIFFSSGTWLFWETDSLIRLFPEKLWVDGFTIAGGIAVFSSVLIILIALWGRNKMRVAPRKKQK